MIRRKAFLACFLVFHSFSLAQPGDTTAPAATDWRQTLFDGIDLSIPELNKVLEAIDRHELIQAQHAWAEYLRHRTSVPWTFDPQHPLRGPSFKRHVADAAAKGTVQGGLVPILHTFADNRIDWLLNPTIKAPGVAPNFEWQWQLCRMSFWGNLAHAYRATGDERYAAAWIAQFRSFAAQCPPPEKQQNDHPSAWRTIDSGIRMSNAWPDAFFSFLLSPAFTDEDVAEYSYFVLMHGRYLKSFPTSGNWVTMEMCGLFTAACVFPEMKESSEWRAFAANRLHAEETTQFLPDGAQYELSPGYHNTALDNLIGIVRIAKLVGRLNELPPGYIAGLERAYDFEMYLMTPDGSLPKFNDSGWDVGVRSALHDAAEFFPDRADYRWISTKGKEGAAPAATSWQFPWAGFYAMRSGWGPDANYIAFRAGPLGYGHWHQDKLNVLFWSYGREILFDSGGGSYERSKWRDYETSTFGHNTVLVDGKPQERQTTDRMANVSKSPIDARWQSTPTYDFAAGTYEDGYGSITARIAKHTRRVLFIKPDMALIADTLEPADTAEHTYQARWNLNSTHTISDPSTSAVITQDAGLPNLAVVPLQTHELGVQAVSAQTTPEVLGWYIFKDHTPAEVPATTVLHTIRGTGAQNLVTLLVPLATGESLPIDEIRQPTPTSWNIHFKDGRKFSVDVDPSPAGGMQVNESLLNGNAGRKISIPSTQPAS